jgi:hypothetical protein
MRKLAVSGLIVGVLLLGGGVVSGQGADALAAYVAQVADNLMNQETAVFEGASEVIIDMDMGGAAQHIEVTADITGEYEFADGDFGAWYTMLDQAFSMAIPGAGQMAFDLTTESLMADATLYERYTSTSPMFGSAFPSGWHVVDDAAGTPGAGPMGDPTAMLPGIDITKLPYIIGQKTVVAATELPPEVIDGREMRVFNVELDMEAVSLQMSAWMSGISNEELDSEDAELITGLMPELFSELVMEWTVWIDTAADLPYRSMGTMVGPLMVGQQGMNVVMELELAFDMTFTDFNVPVTIEPPELGT